MIVPGFALVLLTSLAIAQKDNGDECNCFRTNESSAGYFTNHQFHDFRNVDDALLTVPSIIKNATDNANAPATFDFSTGTTFAGEWTPVNWDNSDTLGTADSDATVFMVNSPNNVYIGR
jgi:hypothetical protein